MRSERLRFLASALILAVIASGIVSASAGPTRAERRKNLKLGADAGSPTKESEAAVDGALEWLVRHQEADGHPASRASRGFPGQSPIMPQ